MPLALEGRGPGPGPQQAHWAQVGGEMLGVFPPYPPIPKGLYPLASLLLPPSLPSMPLEPMLLDWAPEGRVPVPEAQQVSCG